MPEREHRDGILPTPNAENRGAAVLLPDCKPEPITRRGRKSDYPKVGLDVDERECEKATTRMSK